MFNIARFSANIKEHGTLQTNKFIVRIPNPQLFNPSQLDPIIEYRANNVRIPGVALDTQRVFRYGVGPEQKFPTNINFTDINVNFVDTQNKDIWKRFSFWFNGIFDYTGTSGGRQASYKTEYKDYYTTDLEIHVFDNDGNRVNIVVLKEAFPTTLSEVGLSWSENNRLYEFSVGFAFKEWYFAGYQVGAFRSGAVLGPASTSAVQPRRTESPRPTAPRSDPFGLNATPGNETGTAGPVNPGNLNF